MKYALVRLSYPDGSLIDCYIVDDMIKYTMPPRVDLEGHRADDTLSKFLGAVENKNTVKFEYLGLVDLHG